MNRATMLAAVVAVAGLAAAAAVPAAPAAPATFDWSTDASHGSFVQSLKEKATAEVGVIPAGMHGVRVRLTSPQDADIQLSVRESGELLVGWPNGALKALGRECRTLSGMEICYSGYNGGGTVSTTGNEYIEIKSWTTHDLVLSAYGYKAADANVTYEWKLSGRDCTVKDGTPFTATGEQGVVSDVGVVPAGTTEVDIELSSANDVDLQVFDGATKVVAWVGGLLRSHKHECRDYKGVNVCYSGYNGDGTGVGQEFVRMRGKLPADLRIAALYYKGGDAHITYSFKADHAECMTLPTTRPFRFVVPGRDSYNSFARLGNESDPYHTRDVVDRAVARLGGAFLLRHRPDTPSVPHGAKVEVRLRLLTHTDAAVEGEHAEYLLEAARGASGPANLTSTEPQWTVRLPSQMPVGRYRLAVLVGGAEVEGALPVNSTLYVLFDPRAHGVTKPEELHTYVLQEKGPIWYGSASAYTSLQWGFNQFEQLDAAMEIVERMVGLKSGDRWLPHRLVREVTYMLGNEVLYGRWDGRYSDGVAPSTWTDSGMILQAWRKNPGQQVRYGQCWVFSGLTTTVLRSLGLAARSVTNFESAHDHHPYDMMIERAGGESVWNFHVWNEVRISHAGFSGWWALDSTPQEVSGGYYQCGPTPVRDVHDLPLARAGSGVPSSDRYDTAFISAEVDSHIWLAGAGVRFRDRNASAAVRNDEFDPSTVGQAVSTERAACSGHGNACRLDVSNLYRTQGARGARAGTAAAAASFLEEGDAAAPAPPARHFRVVVQGVDPRTNRTRPATEAPRLGDALVMSLFRTATALPGNASAADVTATVTTELTEYSGDVLQVLSAAVMTPRPCAAGHACFVARLEAAEYAPHLYKASSVLVHAEAKVAGRSYTYERDVLLVAPRGAVAVALPAGGLQRYKRFRAAVVVTNPLPVPLTHLVVAADTPGSEDVETVAFNETIPPHGRVTLSTGDLVASVCGAETPYTVAVAVSSAQLNALLRGEVSAAVSCTVEVPREGGGKDQHAFGAGGHVVHPGTDMPAPAAHSCCASSSPCEAVHLHTCSSVPEPQPPVAHDCCAQQNVTCPMSAMHTCHGGSSGSLVKVAAVEPAAPAAPAAPVATPAPAAATAATDRKATRAGSQTVVVSTTMVPVTYD